MDIKELVQRSYDQAKKSGFEDPPPTFSDMTSLLHSEVSEAYEAYRRNEPTSWTDEKGKPQGIASEFADVMIRIGHYCVNLDINLDAEIERKMAYNATRSFRHGGKKA